MNLINKTRGSGKTSMLIITSYNTKYPIIVYSEEHKNYIKQLSNRIGVCVIVYTLKEFKELPQYDKNRIRKVLVDDVEDFLEEALRKEIGGTISAATASIYIDETEIKISHDNY